MLLGACTSSRTRLGSSPIVDHGFFTSVSTMFGPARSRYGRLVTSKACLEYHLRIRLYSSSSHVGDSRSSSASANGDSPSSSVSHSGGPERSGHTIQYTSGETGNVSSKKIKIDPLLVETWEDLQLKGKLVKTLRESFPKLETPNAIQKRMLALLNSEISVIAKSPPQTGKSIATCLHLLSQPRKSHDTITSLLLVPTPDLAKYYASLLDRLTGSAPNKHRIFQLIYRGANEQENILQRDNLTTYYAPKILIATPNRVFDFLASEERNILPLNNLSTIVVDEMEDSDHDDGILQSLVSYICNWRDSWVKHNDSEESAPLTKILTFSGPKGLEITTPTWLRTGPVLQVSVSEPPVDNKNDRVIMLNYDEKSNTVRNVEIAESPLDKPEYKQFSKQEKARVQKSFAAAINYLHNKKQGLIVACYSLSITALAKTLNENYGFVVAFPYDDGYSYIDPNGNRIFTDIESFLSMDGASNSDQPRLLITRPINVKGINLSNLKRAYLLWHEGETAPMEILPQLPLAYPSNGTFGEIYALTVPTRSSQNLVVGNSKVKSIMDSLELINPDNSKVALGDL